MGGLVRGKKGKQRAPASDDELVVSGSDSEDRVPKFENVNAEYLNQPIVGQKGEIRLKSIVNDLTALRTQLRDAIEAVVVAAGDAAEAEAKGDEEGEVEGIPEDSETIKAIDTSLRKLIDEQAELEIRTATLSDIRQKFVQGVVITNLLKTYEDAVKERLDVYREKTARQKYADQKPYIDFRTSVWENLHAGSAVPNIKTMIAAEPNDEEDDDDDIEIGAQQSDYKCPMTLTTLKDPMSSKICKHSFSAVGIVPYLKNGPAPCPISGCPKTLSMADMYKDKALERRVEAHERRTREKQAEERESGTAPKGTQYVEMSDDDDDE